MDEPFVGDEESSSSGEEEVEISTDQEEPVDQQDGQRLAADAHGSEDSSFVAEDTEAEEVSSDGGSKKDSKPQTDGDPLVDTDDEEGGARACKRFRLGEDNLPHWAQSRAPSASARIKAHQAAIGATKRFQDNSNFNIDVYMESKVDAEKPAFDSDDDEDDGSYHSESHFVEETLQYKVFDEEYFLTEEGADVEFFVRVISDGESLLEGFLPTRSRPTVLEELDNAEKGEIHFDFRELPDSIHLASAIQGGSEEKDDDDSDVPEPDLDNLPLSICVLAVQPSDDDSWQADLIMLSRGCFRPSRRRPRVHALEDSQIFMNDNHNFFIKSAFCLGDGGKIDSLSMVVVHHSD